MALLIIPVLKRWWRARGPYGYLRTWYWTITAREISQPYNKYNYLNSRHLRLFNDWRNIKVCANSELRRPAINLVKRDNYFVSLRTLDKVDSAGRVTLLPGTTFLRIRRGCDLYKRFKSAFLRIFQKLAGQHESQRWPLGKNVILSSVTWCGRNNKQSACVSLEIRICQIIAM